MTTEFNIASLVESAKTRWFQTNEIVHLLKNIECSNLKAIISEKLPERPSNGSFFLIDTSTTNKKWKQDGFSYVKRNNGVGFREDVVYLKMGGKKEVMCSYSYMDMGFSEQSNSPTCRRIYKLVNPQGNHNYFLVHYFNEKCLNDGSTEKTPDTRTTGTPFSGLSTSDEVPLFKTKRFEEETMSLSPKETDYFEKAINAETFETLEDKNIEFISYFESSDNTKTSNNTLFAESHNLFQDNFYSSFLGGNNQQMSAPIQQEDKFMEKPVDYSSIQTKFADIENRLNTLELGKTGFHFQPISSFPSYDEEDAFKIVDYSPEWDYTKGGSKVIICVNPLCVVSDLINERLKVHFGESKVPGYFIQPGVIKCYAPPHREGFTRLSLSIDGKTVTSHSSGNLFEYRKKQKPKVVKAPIGVRNEESENINFKIRVVEKMREYDNIFGSNMQSGQTYENGGSFKKYMDMDLKEEFDLNENELLETLEFLNKNKPAAKEAEFHTFLNSVDQDGFALIHYLCYLRMNKCLLFVLNSGALANLVSKSGVTPLEISLNLKDEEMLEILLSNGALGPKKIDEILKNSNDGLPPANLDIASLYKDRNLLDILLREVSLCDSINQSLPAADGAESAAHSDESYLSLYDLLDDRFEQEGVRDEESLSSYSENKSQKRLNDVQLEERRAAKRPRRYFRDYGKKNVMQKESVAEAQKKMIDPVIITDHQNQVQLIQKNVRGWLLRRQYLDILHATRVLQNYMRNKIAKKKPHEKEEDDRWDKIIQDKLKNKVKDWLNIKE